MTDKTTEFKSLLLHAIRASTGSDSPNKADIKFIQDMIPHHKMAVEMATKVLNSGKDEWVAKLARAIISAQNKEIEDMQKWLDDNKPSGSGNGGGMDM